MAAVTDDAREQQLAWEARQRPRAGVAAILAGLLVLAGPLWRALALRDAPPAGFLESLTQAVQSGPIGRETSVKVATYEYYQDNAFALIGSGVVDALGLLALAWLVTFLAAATRARRPEFIRLAVYITLVGGVLFAISAVTRPARHRARGLRLPRRPEDGRRRARHRRQLAADHRFAAASDRPAGCRRRPVPGLAQRHARRAADALPRHPRRDRRGAADPAADAAAGGPVVLEHRGRADAAGRRDDAAGVAHRQGRAVADRDGGRAAPPRAEDRKQGITRPEPEPQPVPAARPHSSSKKRKRKRRG